MANTINVTACDNELIIKVFQWSTSYELCTILSGNSNAVSVNLTLSEGLYCGPVFLNGVDNPLNVSLDIPLPAGDYSLQLLGTNWGSVDAFSISVNGVPYQYSEPSDPAGLVYSPAPIAITV